MKRYISLLLSLSFIFSLCPHALAADNQKHTAPSSDLNDFHVSEAEILAILPSSTEYDELYSQVVNDLANLSSVYIEPDICTPVSLDQDGLVRYCVSYPNGIINHVTTERNADGCLVLHFYEDEIHNEVIFLKDGKLLVDGQLVNVQNNNLSAQSYAGSDNSTIMPIMRNADYSLTPWGSASDYTIYRGYHSSNTCSWDISTLLGVATGVVATIICYAVNAGLGLSIGSSIFSGVAAAMITRCEIYGMEDAYFSWEFYIYERVDSMSIDRYYQYTDACWSQRNLSGHRFPHTYYENNWFS